MEQRKAHIARIVQGGTAGWLQASPAEGFLVQCPHGCSLGGSARQFDRQGAERRAELHRIATAPLGEKTSRPDAVQGKPCVACGAPASQPHQDDCTAKPGPLDGLAAAFDAERERIERDAETRVTEDEARTDRRMARLPGRVAAVEAANTASRAASRAAATAYDPETMSREITAWAGTDPHRRAFLADILGAVSFDGPADGERGTWNDQAD